jgi:hypothetical protein
MSKALLRDIFVLVAVASGLLLSGCAVGDYATLTGVWQGDVAQSTFLYGDTNSVTLTITINADKTWSWSTVCSLDTYVNSSGSGTYTLDTSAKTGSFTIAACSSNEVALGTAASATYSVDSTGKVATFDFQGMTSATGGSVSLTKQ